MSRARARRKPHRKGGGKPARRAASRLHSHIPAHPAGRIGRLRLSSEQRRLWETLLFLAKVIALSVPLYLVIIFSLNLAPLQMADVQVSSAMLRALGYQVSAEGAMMSVGSENPFIFYLTEDCTPWKSFLFLFALIFAVPAVAMRKRLLGLAAGLPVLWLGNQARILGVVLTERAAGVQFAMFTHDFMWRGFLVFLVVGVWLLWMRPPALTKASQRRMPFRLPAIPRLITKRIKIKT